MINVLKNAYVLTISIVFVIAGIILFASKMRETSAKPIDPAEYQLIIVDDSIIISDHGRHVTTIHIDSTGEIGTELIKDNL